MTSHRRRLLSVAFTLFAIAGLISAQSTTAATRALTPDQVAPFEPLNDMFHVYGDLTANASPTPRVWTGGDTTFSVVLPDGRTVWIFSDTFLSPNGPCAESEKPCHNRTLFVAPFVNNSFLIQEGPSLTRTLYDDTAETANPQGPPTALIKPPFPNDSRSFYWMGDGIVEGDKLHAFVHRYPVVCCGLISPTAEATDVATFSLPSLTLDGITEGVSATGGVRPWAFAAPPTDSVAPVTWGAAILEDGQYTYVYGTEEYPLNKHLHVARVPAGQLLSGQWQYYTGDPDSAWSEDPLSSARILRDVAGELSIVKTKLGYRVVASVIGISDIVAYEGPHPFGPWGEQIVIADLSQPDEDVYTPPEFKRGGTIYNAKEHPQLSCSGKSMISYNVNGTLDGKDVFADIHVYRPRFIEVSGLTPVACSNQSPIANDDHAETKMNTAVRVSVLDNDSDPDGDALTVVQVSQPSDGRATINADRTVIYEPRRGFKGIDSFSYVIDDRSGGRDTATVTIDVRPSTQAR